MPYFKIVIISLLVLIFISLLSGLWYLWRDKDNATHVVTSLTWRVGLSALLFLLLLLGLWMGWIQPNA